VIEHVTPIGVKLLTSCPERALFRTVALGLLPSGPRPRDAVPRRAAVRGRSTPNALHSEWPHTLQPDGWREIGFRRGHATVRLGLEPHWLAIW
jgi:hypothetical protein